MKRTPLEQLYAQRYRISTALAAINKRIAAIEKQGAWIAAAKIHHPRGCKRFKGGRKPLKVSKDWRVVDCLKCHRRRAQPEPRNTKVPWQRP